MHSDLACPTCRVPLTRTADGASLACSACDTGYPIVSGRLPILVPDPLRHVTAERQVLAGFADQHEEGARGYAALAGRGSLRAETMRGISHALAGNAALLRDLAGTLPEVETEPFAYQVPPGADLLNALLRDWGGSASAEAEIAATFEAVTGAFGTETPGRCLLLGAGTGRLLCALAENLPEIVGVDLSLGMALLYDRLCETGRIGFHHPMVGNFRRAEDEIRRLEARHALAPRRPAYLVADAARLPFTDGQFDTVLSPYFTDLMPLSRLLPEMRRILRPCGRFLHFGPLGYAFSPGEEEYYAADQLPDAFAQFGFRMGPQRHVETSYLADPRRLNRLGFDNLLFVARSEPIGDRD
ncbi:methyltransferase domain-containing protein [Tropicimonas sp. IMCC6043]|uniref:methyltransferase domain-containing protein n=1 Tax=Tropicimonas sp. IMCC6043 TaxID=2510645 RepID=UPI00101C8CFB|nr:methyltransferase domain-containing protein [Tropicimonas sp. IMCC6043]RYH11509.1 methyltransferase domain-containing protein [Tropicimonas sp. IMCC6043]